MTSKIRPFKVSELALEGSSGVVSYSVAFFLAISIGERVAHYAARRLYVSYNKKLVTRRNAIYVPERQPSGPRRRSASCV